MDKQPVAHPDYESLQSILNAIAQWMRRYRQAGNTQRFDELLATGVENMARELKITPAELATLARKGPDAADLLQKLLIALGVDPNGVEHDDPSVCETCSGCAQHAGTNACELDLANGVSADKFRDYCPNAFTLDALLQAKQERRRRRPTAQRRIHGK
jgi:hypothetical protein